MTAWQEQGLLHIFIKVVILCLFATGCSEVMMSSTAESSEDDLQVNVGELSWPAGLLPHDYAPVDLRYLNHKPAGIKGAVYVDGDTLLYGDGTPARFWGTNIAAYSLFNKSKQDVEIQARRIAQLGHNLVRIHHHDSTRWVNPTVIDQSQDDSRQLDENAMQQLDYLIHCLREEGVYIWLDLHVGRQIKPGDIVSEWGEIHGYDELKRQDGYLIGFNYYNEAIRGLMQEFNELYLNHVNLYTGLAYKEDPAIVGLLITNENDLTSHFGNLMLPDKNNPVHHALFDASVRAFCEDTGLPYQQTWRTWEPGPSKIYLNHQENVFNNHMLSHLREMGITIPIATTNQWGNNSLYSLPALTAGDLIDAHSYGSEAFLSRSIHESAHFVHWIAAAQVHGMPLTVTEWNVPYPTKDRFTAPMFMAAIASLQSWDAMMLYNYSQQGLGKPDQVHLWSTWVDPAITALIPAAAIAYREGHISPAKEHYCLQLDRAQLFYSAINPETSVAIRTLTERSRITIGMPEISELPWLEPTIPDTDVTVITDPAQRFINQNQNYIQSDTGELYRNWEAGYHTINTEKTQAAVGNIGGRTILLSDVEIDIRTPQAAIVVTSLDGQPIRESQRILITAVARAIALEEKLPFHSEPIVGTLKIHAQHGLTPVALARSEDELLPVSFTHEVDSFNLQLNENMRTHWYLLQ